MGDNRFASTEQYASQQADIAKAAALPFFDVTEKGLQAIADWQKFFLDITVRARINLAEYQKGIVDAAAQQSINFVRTAQQQFVGSLSLLTDSTQVWLDNVRVIQETFAGAARRVTKETKKTVEYSARELEPEWDRITLNWDKYRGKVHDRWRELSNETLEASRGNLHDLARAIERTYKIGKQEAYNQLDDFLEYTNEQPAQHD